MLQEIMRTHAQRTALTATVLGFGLLLGGCADDPAPPFEIEGTGAIEGFLFLDANDDGVFDPSAGDEPVPGVEVSARERGTTRVLGSATTAATGRFLIDGVPPGTHELFFTEGTVPAGAVICQNPVPATFYLNETGFRQVQARSACLVTIAEAQATALGEFVIVRGVVTSFPGQTDPGFTNIQDATGGMFLFAPNLEGQGIEVGDLIEVGGTLALFSDRLQLTGIVLRDRVDDFGAPAPRQVTVGELAASTDARDPLQNMLVTVKGARLTTGFTSGGSRNATISNATGSSIIRVEDNVSPSGEAALAALGLTVGNCYDITGIVGTFFGTAQLFPRSAADFVEVACTT